MNTNMNMNMNKVMAGTASGGCPTPTTLRGNVYRCILYTAVELYTVDRCIPL